MRESNTKTRSLTEVQQAELDALDALADEAIDTSDIPEITDDRWALARKGQLYRPVKQSVTIRLDADILEWFKSHAQGRGYQTEINTALRRYIAEQLKRSG
ncbi:MULTISPECIES: BrnA antitoxin family protein [unclassified Rhizobium]|uniref:BrnA antitoxin family protein n=1 Tax=unclassified Rhizobium TaxID=2613769 RepID=UPI001AD9A248|nr:MULTISPECIES: BrnA antitoxin family protein [unclassified Rhizobium]MBO9124699.1 BrnA antitoxin family protein [Rhizobium sp. 16-488-2b]MBO9175283.1 BrnA antitoxin family protein [Rhizobium sp. 16-488-2a]